MTITTLHQGWEHILCDDNIMTSGHQSPGADLSIGAAMTGM